MNQKLMKKSLITLAVLGAFAGAAQAQTASVVTLYGSFDGGIRRVTNVNANGDSNMTMGSNGTYNSNRIGFRGTEDLGGGNNAHFNLETGFNTGTGVLDTNLFHRAAYVGMGGSWGSLDLGRQYTVAFKTIGTYDPFNYKYTGILPPVGATAGVRNNNDVQYTGTFGPVTARAEWALGEVAGSNSNGSAKAIGVVYAGGPITVGLAHTEKKPGNLDYKNDTIGGAYKMGPMRVAVGYTKDKQKAATTATAGDTTKKDIWVGGSFAVTPTAEISLAYYKIDTTRASTVAATGEKKLLILGATYAMSKRTNLYADIDQAKYKGLLIPASTKDKVNGVSIGMNHTW
jgi:predicted porin